MFLKKINEHVESPVSFPVRAPDQRAVEKAFARLFATEDGQLVLSHLSAMTFQRAYGPEAPDEQLRHAEGQRALMAGILRLIDRGRQ